MDTSNSTATTTATKQQSEDAVTTTAPGGGIGWQSGSLVGSQNPANFGYRYSHVRKRYKKAGSSGNDDDAASNLPSNIVVQLQNRQGESMGETLDLPIQSNVDALSALVSSLKNDEDGDDDGKTTPYAFYATVLKNGIQDDVEITTTLADFIVKHKVSTEEILQLTYQPLAVFRVRPVTRCTDTLPGHTEAILHVSYSPNGRQLASGGGDTTVRFWDTRTSLPKHTCRGHANHVLCTAWSPNGQRFASADKNGVLILWDPTTGKALKTIKAHKTKWITSLAWEPMHLCKAGGKCERIATAGRDGLVKIFNVRTGQCQVTLSGHADSVESIKWSGEGWIYSASRDRTIKVWAADGKRDGTLIKTLTGHGHRINALALSCDYVCRTGPFGQRPVQFASDEEAFQAAVQRYKEFQDENHGSSAETLVSGSDDFTLFVWHPRETKHPIKRLTGHQQAVNHIAFSPDGRFFASAAFDKKVKVWNGKSGEFIATLTGHVGAVYQVAWSSDSRYLVSASKDSTAKLWEIPAGKAARETLPGHADEVYALDWSPDGSGVATGSKDRTIKIWKH